MVRPSSTIRPLLLAAAAVALVAGARPDAARADRIHPGSRAPSVQLASVSLVSGDAPEVDRRAATSDVRRALAAQGGRIDRCLAGADLREDPIRGRTRRLSGQLTFNRSTRPQIRIDGGTFPAGARRCVREGVSAIAIGRAPRGSVTVRFGYTLR